LKASKPSNDKQHHKRVALAVNRELAKDNDRLMRALNDIDDFRAIVLGMSFLEILLREIVEDGLVYPPALQRMQLTQTADLALALGVVGWQTCDILKELGSVRNLFAHSVAYMFHKNDLDLLRAKIANAQVTDFVATLVAFLNTGHATNYPNAEGLSEEAALVRAAILLMHIDLRSNKDRVISVDGND
jgi:hypothetical protein